MQVWRRIHPTIQTKLDRKTFVFKTFIQPGGETATFITNYDEGSETAAIIALTTDNQVIIARQFRPGPEVVMEELPGGFVDLDETPEAAARRELLEETGYKPGEVEYLGYVWMGSYTNTKQNFFLARNCRPVAEGQQLEESEYVDVILISVQQLLDNACKGLMTDTAAVLMAYEKLRLLQET